MKRYCRWCKEITDFQIWSEWVDNSRQKQMIVCPKCEHMRSYQIRNKFTGDIDKRWRDQNIAIIEQQPHVKRLYNQMLGTANEKTFEV